METKHLSDFRILTFVKIKRIRFYTTLHYYLKSRRYMLHLWKKCLNIQIDFVLLLRIFQNSLLPEKKRIIDIQTNSTIQIFIQTVKVAKQFQNSNGCGSLNFIQCLWNPGTWRHLKNIFLIGIIHF